MPVNLQVATHTEALNPPPQTPKSLNPKALNPNLEPQTQLDKPPNPQTLNIPEARNPKP